MSGRSPPVGERTGVSEARSSPAAPRRSADSTQLKIPAGLLIFGYALVTGLTAVGVHIHVAPADGGDAESGPVDAAAPQPEPGRGRA